MPFIKEGDHVDIVGGPWAGRVGVVKRIAIDDTCGQALVFVDALKANGWEFETGFVAPLEIKRRKLTSRQVERLDLMHQSHLMEEEDRKEGRKAA